MTFFSNDWSDLLNDTGSFFSYGTKSLLLPRDNIHVS